jgi:hypothetical protein
MSLSIRERLGAITGKPAPGTMPQGNTQIARRFDGPAPKPVAPKNRQYVDRDGNGDDDYDLDLIPEDQERLVRPRPQAPPKMSSCLAPDGRARRDNGNLMPFVSEEKSYPLPFAASGNLFAKLVTVGTLNTSANRKYLLRGTSPHQDKFDNKWIYAVGVDVDASTVINDVLDRDASIAVREFFRNRLALAGLKGSSENDTLFLSGVPVKHLTELPLKLRPDQINQVNQDGWSLRLDYPGVGRLDYATLTDLAVDAQDIALTLRVKAWFADSKAEAAQLAQRGVYNPLTQDFELAA